MSLAPSSPDARNSHLKNSKLPLSALVFLLALLTGQFIVPVHAQAPADQAMSEESDRTGWTALSSQVHDAASGGDDFWLAQDGGVVRWNIEDGVIEQITQFDGLPHAIVYAVVVDEAGTLWLSGDAGVSRRDPSGKRTHYATELPPIAQGETLALGSSGDLWVGHGTDKIDQVSRLTADGEWVTYASVKDAVEADFAAALTTINRQSLWSVSYGEIWSGLEAYDGSTWTTRMPPVDSGEETVLDELLSDATGNLYVNERPAGKVWQWNGAEWQMYIETNIGWDFSIFLITPNGSPWQITRWSPGPGHLDQYALSNLLTDASVPTFAPFQPFVWAGDEQIMVFDPTLITQATQDGATENDWAVAYSHLNQGSYLVNLRTNDAGDLYVYDHSFSSIGYWSSRIRRLDTSSAPTLEADQWTPVIDEGGYRIDAWEISPDESIWSLTRDGSNFISKYVSPPRQRSSTLDVSYPNPPNWTGEAPNGRLWIVDPETVLTLTGNKVHRLQNNGTPTDFDDDRWKSYTDAPAGRDLVEDFQGFTWISATFYDAATEKYVWAAYRYHEPSESWSNQLAWSPLSVGEEQHQLVPAQDGTMFFVPRIRDEIIVIWPDFSVETVPMTELATERLALLRTTERRNARWVIDRDGALWFTRHDATTGAAELVKHTESETAVYAMPDAFDWFTDLVTDAYGHIWTTGSDGYTIWRQSSLPDFALVGEPSVLLATPASETGGMLSVDASSEFSETVSVTVTDLPQGISLVLGAEEIMPGESIPFSVSVSTAAAGSYQVLVTARSGAFVRTQTISIVIFDRTHALFLPSVSAH